MYTYKDTCENIYMCNYTYYSCNRIHSNKTCLGCFLDMHLYSNRLSSIAKASLLIKSEFFPACFSCHNNVNLSHKSLESDGKGTVFEITEAMIAGDLSNFIIHLSRSLLRLLCLISNFISFPNS